MSNVNNDNGNKIPSNYQQNWLAMIHDPEQTALSLLRAHSSQRKTKKSMGIHVRMFKYHLSKNFEHCTVALKGYFYIAHLNYYDTHTYNSPVRVGQLLTVCKI